MTGQMAKKSHRMDGMYAYCVDCGMTKRQIMRQGARVYCMPRELVEMEKMLEKDKARIKDLDWQNFRKQVKGQIIGEAIKRMGVVVLFGLLSGCQAFGLPNYEQVLDPIEGIAEERVTTIINRLENRRCNYPMDIVVRIANERGQDWMNGWMLQCGAKIQPFIDAVNKQNETKLLIEQLKLQNELLKQRAERASP